MYIERDYQLVINSLANKAIESGYMALINEYLNPTRVLLIFTVSSLIMDLIGNNSKLTLGFVLLFIDIVLKSLKNLLPK